MNDNNSLESCYIALNLLPRFLRNVRFTGDHSILSRFPPSHTAKINLGNDKWKPEVTLVFGKEKQESEALYVYSSGWSSCLSRNSVCEWSYKPNKLAAVFSGALAVGEVFKELLESIAPREVRIKKIQHFEYDLLTQGTAQQPVLQPDLPETLYLHELTLVGCGAVGQAIAYTLKDATRLVGRILLIDHEKLEPSNEQRYLLAFEENRGVSKVNVLLEPLTQGNAPLTITAMSHKYEEVVTLTGFPNNVEMIAALDNIPTRIHMQASLPKTLWNVWTDSNEKTLRYGMGCHSLEGPYSCLACEYFPTKEASEAKMISLRTGFPEEEVIRRLAEGDVITKEDLMKIEKNLKLPPSSLISKIGKYVIGRTFMQFIHGDCGVFQWDILEAHAPTPAPHVPVLAAVELVSQFIFSKLDISKTNYLLESVADFNALTVPNEKCFMKKFRLENCFCSDPDYQKAYNQKWNKG